MAAVLEREPYTPRHRSNAPLTGRQVSRETVAEVRIRHAQPNLVHGHRGTYGAWASFARFSHPDDRLPLGLATTTETRAA